MAASNEIMLCEDPGDQGKYDQLKLMDNDIAVQFSVTKPVSSVRIYVAKASAVASKGSFTASLYVWNGSYGETLKGRPVANNSFSDLKSGDYAVFDLTSNGEAPGAGEYLLYMTNGKSNIHLGTAPASGKFSGKARVYYNGSPIIGRDLAVSLVWAKEAGELGAISDNEQKFVTSSATWVVTDGLGRKVENSYTDTRREGKTVGLFFHTWHTSNSGAGTRNITSILKEHPEIQNDYSSKLWGNAGSYFWNEPIWGYYRSDDEWVLRKQAELLADAGVDAVFFDNTNGTATFIDDVLVLCKVWSKARADGVKTPKISFMLPMFDYNDVATQLREIYSKLYGAGLYSDLWFYWKGKPLIIGYPGRLKASSERDMEILNFFNFRVINHAQSEDHVQVQAEDGTPVVMGAIQSEVTDSYQLWNWISVYPQLINRNPDGTPEQVAVAIAHNWCAETHLTAMNNPKFQVFGRHYDPVKGAVDTRENAKLYGAYFNAQWEYALSIDPEFIWVTGWNEWVAGRFKDFWGVENAFPDNFSDEYSRDIEPSRGDLKDHYYYQLVNFIRRYKGTEAAVMAEGPAVIDINTGAGWETVGNVYETYSNDTFDRSAKGYVNSETGKNFMYTNDTGRNDISLSKAAYDADNVYFMAETAEDLTPYTDPAWMRLLIEVESVNGNAVSDGGANWESFQYIIGREPSSDGVLRTFERSTGGWNWEKTGDVNFTVSGNRVQIAVPRQLLGLAEADSFVLNFKWSDNMQVDGDILDFYVNGDVAPEGRYKYQLAVGKTPEREADKQQKKSNSATPWIIAAAAAGTAAAAALTAAIVVKKRKSSK
ncbi:MAG: hypothetical protein J5950_02955 [Clostridia bacterium]|nr:hypothetical protein [Clostridia bacterium]